MIEFSFFYPDFIYAIYIFFWISFFWNSYVEFRQYSLLVSSHEVPDPISQDFSLSQLQGARAYQIDLMIFSFVFDLYGQIELTFILYFGLLLKSWIFVAGIFTSIGFDSTYEILHSEFWLFMLNIICTSSHQPWIIYKTFVLEHKHGFNKMSLSMYCLDLLKSFIINQIILIPTVAIFITIVQWSGDYFCIYAWLFLSSMIIFLMMIYPTWIAPMFDTYTLLGPGELKNMIEALSKSVSFPLKKIFIVDSSRRSAHSNAYFYGFWKNQRIVLFDTLLSVDKLAQTSVSNLWYDSKKDTDVSSNIASENQITDFNLGDKLETCHFKMDNVVDETEYLHPEKLTRSLSNPEILAIVCHELGHWYHNHNFKSLLINELVLLAYIVLFSLILTSDAFYVNFGFLSNKPIIVGIVIIFGFIFAPFDCFLSFGFNTLIRKYEYSADAFAAEMGFKSLLISSLIKISRDNKSYPIYDHLYSIFHKHHPSVLERIYALNIYKSE